MLYNSAMHTFIFALLFWPGSSAAIKTATCIQIDEPRLPQQMSGPAKEYNCDVVLTKSTKQQLTINFPASTKTDKGAVVPVPPYTKPMPISGTVIRFAAGRVKPVSVTLGTQTVNFQ